AKACYVGDVLTQAPPPPQEASRGPAGYTFCATENQTCSFTGSKRRERGANNKFTFLNLVGGTPCTIAVFGDPIVGTVKACYVSDVSTQAPPPSQPPAGAQAADSNLPGGITHVLTVQSTTPSSGLIVPVSPVPDL